MYPFTLLISTWELIMPLLDRHNITPKWTKLGWGGVGFKENGTYNGALGQMVKIIYQLYYRGAFF